MKKPVTLIVYLFACCAAFAQGPKYYLDNSLVFKNMASATIDYPFVGGLLSPQFSNIDLNNDGTKDLFVFDRGTNKTLTYIRSTGGGPEWIYAPQYEFGFPKMISWALLADYNGDGKEDIFTAADPAFHPQAVKVYKNVSVNGVPAFEVATEELTYDQNIQGLPKGPVYWIDMDISAIDDIDGDGDLDILSFDASAASITLYGNEAKEKGYPLDSLVFRAYDECWGNFRESFTDRSVTLGVECFGNRIYPKSGIHSGSTMLFVDMDDDGDKELILGDASYDELTLLTNGKKNFNWPYDSITAYDTIFPRNTTKAKIYTFPAAFYADVTNDNVKDLLVAPNLSAAGKTLNQVWFYKNNGTNTKPKFDFVKNNFLQDNMVDLGSGAIPVFFDVDNDKDLDLIVSNRGDYEQTLNAADRLDLFLNTGDTSKPGFKHQSTDYLNLIKDSIRDLKPAFGDLSGDGKPDMVIGDANGRLWYYQNNSSTTLNFAPPVKSYMNIDIGFAAAPQIIDLDNDGLLDLAIGTGGGFIDFFKNKGSKTAPQFDSVPDIDTVGGVYVNSFYWYYILDGNGQVIDSVKTYDFNGFAAPHFADLDGDKKLELLVGCHSGKLWLFNNVEGNLGGKFTEIDTFVYNNITKAYGGFNPGIRTVPFAAKLTDTLNPMLFLGNFRGGLNFLNAVKDTTNINPSIGMNELHRELFVTVYPNPTGGQVTISRSLQQYDGELALTVTDMLGRTVYNGTVDEGENQFVVNFGGLQAGIYYLQLKGGNSLRTVQKITVLR